VQLLAAGYALRLDRERLTPLWSLPFQLVVYRQLMYLVTVQSTVTALTGIRLRWHSVTRTGDADQMLADLPLEAQTLAPHPRRSAEWTSVE
jgi:hypothetical protein